MKPEKNFEMLPKLESSSIISMDKQRTIEWKSTITLTPGINTSAEKKKIIMKHEHLPLCLPPYHPDFPPSSQCVEKLRVRLLDFHLYSRKNNY